MSRWRAIFSANAPLLPVLRNCARPLKNFASRECCRGRKRDSTRSSPNRQWIAPRSRPSAFCLGGLAALELARAGADLKAVVSFHGSLTTLQPAEPGRIKGKILVGTGSLDPIIPFEQVAAFAKEMDDAAVDWQVILYGGAKHGFTNPAADRAGHPGIAYHEPSDLRSWQAMRQFLSEAFGS